MTKEYRERDDGSVAETHILTDRFVFVTRTWHKTLAPVPGAGADHLLIAFYWRLAVIFIHSPGSRPPCGVPWPRIPCEVFTMASAIHYQPRFQPGQLVMTAGVNDLIQQGVFDATAYIQRHLNGDWGDLCDEDRQANDTALIHGTRLLSSYQVAPAATLWIITEWDRSVTTLLLPNEY